MPKPETLILTGFGINCEEETAFAFETAGALVKIIHINDLIENKNILDQYKILVFPGGFSYGDDTGSGKALANRLKNNLNDEISRFIERDTLILGICNGFQALVNLGLLPLLNGYTAKAQAALEYNEAFRYQCRWIDLMIEKGSPSVFTKGIESLHIPVAHGEGKFYAEDNILKQIESLGLVSMRYIKNGVRAELEFPYNPNGSINDIASICSPNGRIMGMMPHPERGMFFTQREDWTLLKEVCLRDGKEIPVYSDGLKIFNNAINYFK
ncbi:MAG: phosphoribosylformylglycinamidine synthase subunit PurQ [Leptospirales bacterium]|nr:phosphoribosylformylglycinamidine synthase subunit PurQ [Leptospirales bacterium]